MYLASQCTAHLFSAPFSLRLQKLQRFFIAFGAMLMFLLWNSFNTMMMKGKKMIVYNRKSEQQKSKLATTIWVQAAMRDKSRNNTAKTHTLTPNTDKRKFDNEIARYSNNNSNNCNFYQWHRKTCFKNVLCARNFVLSFEYYRCIEAYRVAVQCAVYSNRSTLSMNIYEYV